MNAHTFDAAQLASIRRALLIGLTCYGEIENARNFAEVQVIGGQRLPDDATPRHPTGSSDVVELFATALTYVDVQP